MMAAENAGSVCWATFQNCYDWFFMTARPYGYVQNIIFMGMFGVIFLGVYSLFMRHYTLAHVCIFILFLWKMYITSINYYHNANYDYYQTCFAFIFLFLPHKRFFGSFSVVFFYYLYTATKIHESWTLGTYFISMREGLPIFPEPLVMVVTNLLLLLEMIGAWFLFSRHKILQRSIFAFFVFFHLYSGVLVGYDYPSIVMPSLVIFFGPLFKPFDSVPKDLRSLAGWGFLFVLFLLQMVSHLIPGDEKLTLEGNFYGLYMFEANHQCAIRLYNEQGEAVYSYNSTNARNRCDPYRYMFFAQKKFCPADGDKKYSYKMTHSINGGPFYLIVDEPDLCSLTYKPFSHNAWIKTEDQAKPTARPRKNLYY